MLQGLYVLTDSNLFPHREWPDRIEQCILGGANIIQLREKKLTDQELLPYAYIVQEICKHYDVTFIINDRFLLAHKINADGVHIGKSDQPFSTVRQYLGSEFFIGVSCYRNIYKALHLQSIGADYVAFGSVFKSPTKSNASLCPLSVVFKAGQTLSIPVCAIGGINADSIRAVSRTGADMYAATHAVFNAADPQAAANNLCQQAIMRR